MNNKARHVLGLSGGKDSAALAVHMNNNYPNANAKLTTKPKINNKVKINEVKLAPHLHIEAKTTNAYFNDYKRLCKRTNPDPCKRNCCDLLKQRQLQVLQKKASMSKMQSQLESAFKMVVPKYAKRSKPTPGKGHGCGCPPRRTLPPLFTTSCFKPVCKVILDDSVIPSSSISLSPPNLMVFPNLPSMITSPSSGLNLGYDFG